MHTATTEIYTYYTRFPYTTLFRSAARLSEVERAVSGIGYQLDRLDGPKAKNEGDSDDLPKDLSHITPAYKRALWLVIVLNVGYGLIEMVGGFLSGSQADRKSVV